MLKVKSVIGKYEIVSELKGGAQGFVYVVRDTKSNEKYVLKMMFVEESKMEDFEEMIKMWKLLGESTEKDFFVRYVEHFREDRSIVTIMEYCSGGDLDTLIKKKNLENLKFTETEIMKVLIEGTKALKMMRALGFIHRDVKSANILLGADGKYKMSDFNTSKILKGTTGASTFSGTLEYTAAEIVKAEKYSFEVDVFSLGVVLYQMMVGKTPFVNENGINVMNVLLGKYEPISATLGYPQPLIDLVHKCLAVDPSQRPTPARILTEPIVVRALEMASLRQEMSLAMQVEVAALREELDRTKEANRTEVAGLKKELEKMRDEMKKLEETLVGLVQLTINISAFASASPSASAVSPPVSPSTSSSLVPPGVPPAMTIATHEIVRFIVNPHGKVSINGSDVSISGDRTVFLVNDLSTGIFKMRMIFVSPGDIMFGASTRNHSDSIMKGTMYQGDAEAFCQLSRLCAIYLKKECTKLPAKCCICNGDSLALEINSHQHTLHFFYNNDVIPFVIQNVPVSAIIGFSPAFSSCATLRSVMLERLSVASVDPSVQCVPLGWPQ